MYHTQKINQARNQKNLNITRFSQKDSQSDHFTPTEYRITRLINHYKDTPLSNAYIASLVGCTQRTVRRITSKFNKHGLITKRQDNPYSLNVYILDKFFQSEYVLPKKEDLILVDSLFSNRGHVLVQRTRGDKHSHIFNKKRGKKRERIMNHVQKQIIVNNKRDPKIKDAIKTPHIWGEIITPTIQEISKLFDLNEQEQFKLIAFREDVLQHTLNECRAAVVKYRNIGYKIKDRVQWVIFAAKKYSDEKDIKIDWAWYYDLCDILAIEKHVPDRPLYFGKSRQEPGTPKRTSYKGEYDSYKQVRNNPEAQKYTNNPIELVPDEQLRRWQIELLFRKERIATYGGSVGDKKRIVLLEQQIADFKAQQEIPSNHKLSGYERTMKFPLDECIEKLQSELTIHQEYYACYNGPAYMKGLLGRMIERTQRDLTELETRRSDEKQRVLCENSSNSLDPSSQECEPVIRQSDEGQSVIWSLLKSAAWG